MRKTICGTVLYSPSDLIRYVSSPYSSWMDRYLLENPDAVTPDTDSDELKLVARIGEEHEQAVLASLQASGAHLVSIQTRDFDIARGETQAAVRARAPIIYQAAFADDRFAGYSDFTILDTANRYEIWDTKLARTPKPYYAIQLCCYSEMFAATTGEPLPRRFGIILGSGKRVQFQVEDFIHYYRQTRSAFLKMHDAFTSELHDCPEPLPGADHGRWTSQAEQYFEERDHLVRVAGITTSQIKKLKSAGIVTMGALAKGTKTGVPKLATDTLDKLVSQARLQVDTLDDRFSNPEALARYEVLSSTNSVGLCTLPPADPADIFFDMEGYPLVAGGLEYLFGACTLDSSGRDFKFHDWWAHTRNEEKSAFENFVDWAYSRWRVNPDLHIYHYASYEVNALRRLSIQHDSRQQEIDELLKNHVFIDLFKIVRHGIRIGEPNYSIKTVERFYRAKRETPVATAAESIVQYASWMAAEEPSNWVQSAILKGIRDYNEDDCRSTAELANWLRNVASLHGIRFEGSAPSSLVSDEDELREVSPAALRRRELAARLGALADALGNQPDEVSQRLSEIVDFHRREQKPMWWRMFDRADATAEELRDDPGCIEGVTAVGEPTIEKSSLVQTYSFDSAQECKLSAGSRTSVMFSYNLEKMTLVSLDIERGSLQLKISRKGLSEKFDGQFPNHGSLLQYEYVDAEEIQKALADTADEHLQGRLGRPAAALLLRQPPPVSPQCAGEPILDAAIRTCLAMNGDCLVVQGPPGAGKTYTGAHVVKALISAGKTVGVTSNSHKAIDNLLIACGEAMRDEGLELRGIRVLGEGEGRVFDENSHVEFVGVTKDARGKYQGGVVGGTAWLFSRPEWVGTLDYLLVDEAGQVSLANVIAMARCTRNIVMLGDQMQLEQPIQGSHPGDGGLSGLQYILKDLEKSEPDAPMFHSVVPSTTGLFLGESRRMHPDVCSFISEAIYEGRLGSYSDCSRQSISLGESPSRLIGKECGIFFCPTEHDGNIQQSEEERDRVLAIYEELSGRPFTASDGAVRPLALKDFLFIAPYNAQVRSLQAALPPGARVGSVDKFQGQEAPVCVLSLCSSHGEYGVRGLGFILDRSRLNVAISRAQCLAIVVADPRIASTSATTLAEMSLINLLCKVVASGQRRG